LPCFHRATSPSLARLSIKLWSHSWTCVT
jgi:hypothetical protein